MAKYVIRYQANPESWPSDPVERLAVWEQVIAGAQALLDAGTLSEINFTSNMAGYTTLEAPSKAAATEVGAAFFPLFSQEVDEILPWDEAKVALLAGAKSAAGG